jgi:hypothetical protein
VNNDFCSYPSRRNSASHIYHLRKIDLINDQVPRP